jgi:hypothetical protein
MYFGTKSYLKSNRNHNAKQILKKKRELCVEMEFQNKEFKGAFISGEKVNAKKWHMMR